MSLERKLSCRTKTLLETQPRDTKSACKQEEEVVAVPLSTCLRNTIVLSDCVENYRLTDLDLVSQLVDNTAEKNIANENNNKIVQHQASSINDANFFCKVDLTE